MFYVIITNTMAYWYDGAALAATRSPVISLFWCLKKFTTTTTTTNICEQNRVPNMDNRKLIGQKNKIKLNTHITGQ